MGRRTGIKFGCYDINVSGAAVREEQGVDKEQTTACIPYCQSGKVLHGRKTHQSVFNVSVKGGTNTNVNQVKLITYQDVFLPIGLMELSVTIK